MAAMAQSRKSSPANQELLLASIEGFHYRISTDRLFTREEIDAFVRLYENKSTSEAEIHEHLRQNPKFLYALGAYESFLSEVRFCNSTSEPTSLGELRIDFFLKHANGLWDFVELKKATPRVDSLIVGRPTRKRFSAEIQEALAQVRTYLSELGRAETQRELQKYGIHLIRPQAWIIVGRSEHLPLEELRTLEAELPRPCRVLTYDDLTELAKQRLLVITPTIIVPELPADFQSAAAFYKDLKPSWQRNCKVVDTILSAGPRNVSMKMRHRLREFSVANSRFP